MRMSDPRLLMAWRLRSSSRTTIHRDTTIVCSRRKHWPHRHTEEETLIHDKVANRDIQYVYSMNMETKMLIGTHVLLLHNDASGAQRVVQMRTGGKTTATVHSWTHDTITQTRLIQTARVMWLPPPPQKKSRKIPVCATVLAPIPENDTIDTLLCGMMKLSICLHHLVDRVLSESTILENKFQNTHQQSLKLRQHLECDIELECGSTPFCKLMVANDNWNTEEE